jgi:hypothetical protein
MRKSVLVLLLVVLVLGLYPLGAGAYPSLGGATGLVILPTAEVTAPGAVEVAVDYQKVGDVFSDISILPARINVGVADNLELSAGYLKYESDGAPLDYQWTVGAKYALLQEPTDDIGLAIGASYTTIEAGSWDNLNITQAYLALSKHFAFSPSEESPKGRFTAGWSYTKFSEELDDINKPYVGLEILTPNGACLGVEYRWKESDAEYHALLSTVARIPLSRDKSWWAEIGSTNGIYNALSMFDDQKVFYGLAYHFDGQ